MSPFAVFLLSGFAATGLVFAGAWWNAWREERALGKWATELRTKRRRAPVVMTRHGPGLRPTGDEVPHDLDPLTGESVLYGWSASELREIASRPSEFAERRPLLMNGSPPDPNGYAPLGLSPARRHAALSKLGLADGWLLLSVSEMFDLKKTMDSCQAENDRLNKQTAKLLAARIVEAAVARKTLEAAKDFAALVASSATEPTLRVDALTLVANLDEALSILPEPQPPEPRTR